MSEPKKPGFKDIGDLRSKLGLTPSAPAAAPPQDDDEDATQIVGAVTDDQVAMMETMMSPAVSPPGGGAQPGAPAPLAPPPEPGALPPGQGQPHQATPAIPTGPLMPPPDDGPPGEYVSPSMDAIASTPPPDVSQDPEVIQSPFAAGGPLQPPPDGAPGPLAMPPPDMMAAGGGLGAGEATMAAFAPVQRTARKVWISGIVIAALLALVFGYMVGQTNKDRIIINKRISDTERVLKPVKQTVAKMKPVIRALQNANPDRVDWDLAKQLLTYDGNFAVEEVVTDNLLLGPTLSADVIQFAFLASKLYTMAREHGRITLKRHKKPLEDFEKETKAVGGDRPLFLYHVGGKGAIVTIEGDPVKKGRKKLVPVRFLSGAEREVELDALVALDKREMIGASGPNVLEIYSGRIRKLRGLVDEIDKMYERLVMRLQKESSREPVFSL